MSSAGRGRLDKALVARGYIASRAQAEAAIAAGLVTVDGAPARKASQIVDARTALTAMPAHPWVSRGGLKLDYALGAFGVDPTGKACLDVGASTGGFTDVLLARGAASVVAVDVGRRQLHARLKADPRVVDASPCDARMLSADASPDGPPQLIVCDASFIGLMKVVARPLTLAAPGAELAALFKPQFEVGPEHVGKGGVVKNHRAIASALAQVENDLADLGWPVCAEAVSPILGGDGNREFLLYARRR